MAIDATVLGSLIVGLNDGLILFDPIASRLQWNPPACALHGLAPGAPTPSDVDNLAAVFDFRTLDGNTLPVADWPLVRLARGDTFGATTVQVHCRGLAGSRSLEYTGTWIADAQGISALGVLTVRSHDGRDVQAALLESNDRFHSAFYANPAALIVTRRSDGRILEANDAYCRLLGYERSEVVGRLASELSIYVDPDERPRIVARMVKEGGVRDYETVVRARGGELRNVIVSLEPIEVDGDPCILSALLDITGRKHVEEGFRQRSEELAQLFDLLPDAIWMATDAECLHVVGNRYANDLLGVARETNVSQSPGSGSPVRLRQYSEGVELGPDDLPMQKAARTGQPQDNFELRIDRSDGETRILIGGAVPLFDAAGRTRGAVAAFHDITERKRAEDALRASEERFSKTFHASPVAMILGHVPTMSFADVNRSFTDLYGYAREEVIGRHVQEIELLVEGDVERARMREMVRRNGAIHNYEVRTATRSGQVVTVLQSVALIEIDGVAHSLTSLIDITERKAIEQELQRTISELQRSNAELEQFAYVASHDLQEPLRAVAGMVQLLQRRYQGQLDERADEYIALAVESAHRMQALINDLLSYSRVDRRGRPFEPVAAQAALAVALANLEVAVRETGAQITYDDLPTVLADPTQLTQLFQNLVGNGIKFRSDRPLHIHVGATSKGDVWQFTVTDNGIGIETQYFERIFLVFQRLNTRREYPGTGIGLALCKKIVERHGGAIWVESQPGTGSTFCFTLPAVRSPR